MVIYQTFVNLSHRIFEISAFGFQHVHTLQVRTKQVSQCIEFYYNSKRLSEKQRKQSERERESLEEERLAAVINQVRLTSFVMNHWFRAHIKLA